jgi:hypothetical protein
MDSSELDRLGEEIAELSAHLEAATARLLERIRDFDLHAGWSNGFRSGAAWLSWRVGLDLGAARERVRVARALGTLPRLAGAVLLRALEAARETADVQNVSAETPSFPQQQADALALLAETALHHGIDPGTSGERYQVVVHVDAGVLADADHPGQAASSSRTREQRDHRADRDDERGRGAPQRQQHPRAEHLDRRRHRLDMPGEVREQRRLLSLTGLELDHGAPEGVEVIAAAGGGRIIGGRAGGAIEPARGVDDRRRVHEHRAPREFSERPEPRHRWPPRLARPAAGLI